MPGSRSKNSPDASSAGELQFTSSSIENADEDEEEETVDAGSHGSTSSSVMPRGRVVNLTKEDIMKVLQMNQSEAARVLGVSVSTLKRRYYSLFKERRWPYTYSSETIRKKQEQKRPQVASAASPPSSSSSLYNYASNRGSPVSCSPPSSTAISPFPPNTTSSTEMLTFPSSHPSSSNLTLGESSAFTRISETSFSPTVQPHTPPSFHHNIPAPNFVEQQTAPASVANKSSVGFVLNPQNLQSAKQLDQETIEKLRMAFLQAGTHYPHR